VDLNRMKRAAAEAAAAAVADGMVVGLGTGSTASLVIAALGNRVRQGLQIVGIPTSARTAELATQSGIPLSTLARHSHIDLTIDGADEVVRATLDLIKGRGGALLREKIVAGASSRFLIVVDKTKIVEILGTHDPVPVEVIPFGWQATAERLRKAGAEPTLRLDAQGIPYLTDGGHHILDCQFGPIAEPRNLAAELDGIVGVVEHGLFLGMATQVIVGEDDRALTFDREAAGRNQPQ
jgi:ribose 5-phosphate isomerase A